jgi:hypothetical protein
MQERYTIFAPTVDVDPTLPDITCGFSELERRRLMRRILSLVVSVALVMSVVLPAFAGSAAVGRINGVALAQSGQHLAGQLARLRNLQIGHIANVTTTNASGQFAFTGLNAGVYVVELMSNGYVVGTSSPVVLTERDMTANVSATAAGGGQAQAGALAGSFWASTAGIITVAAITAGVITAVVVAKSDESPSQ